MVVPGEKLRIVPSLIAPLNASVSEGREDRAKATTSVCCVWPHLMTMANCRVQKTCHNVFDQFTHLLLRSDEIKQDRTNLMSNAKVKDDERKDNDEHRMVQLSVLLNLYVIPLRGV